MAIGSVVAVVVWVLYRKQLTLQSQCRSLGGLEVVAGASAQIGLQGADLDPKNGSRTHRIAKRTRFGALAEHSAAADCGPTAKAPTVSALLLLFPAAVCMHAMKR